MNDHVRPEDDVALRAADALEAGEDPGEIAFGDTLASVVKLLRPRKVAREGLQLGKEWLKILAGQSDIDINSKDWRFRDPAWTENPVYKRVGQSYLAWCRSLENLVDHDGDWRNRERERFAVELLTSAAAPTNILPGNPAALKRAFETGGRSLVNGLGNFLHDMRYNGGMPSQVDRSGFKLGENLAATPGGVVFRNPVLEIIQYKPQSAKVYRRPVLIITPQINKYYFLDLSPGRSFAEYIVRQGIQTFMVSWRNPGPEQGSWDLDEYVSALLEATEAILNITGQQRLNTFGFCAGGITMSTMAGHLAGTGDQRVHAVSYAVTLLDFETPAMIGMLHHGPLLEGSKTRSKRKGIISGKDMARLFTWFRPNDLVWNYWVNNYLMGKPPPSFDILAWNADSTNLPGGLHGDFLDIFGQNLLTKPGALKVLGVPVDLKNVTQDAFVTGALTDHLTPWRGCYQTTQLLGGKSTFVLSSAGHIASLVNPPDNPKASYFTGPEPGPDCDVWRSQAVQHQGSWWEAWVKWISRRSGEQRNAPRKLGSQRHPVLAPSPGEYVHG